MGWCVLLTVALSNRRLGDDVETRLKAGAGEGGVGPFAREFGGSPDDDRRGDGRALRAVAGEGVGVLEMLGGVAGVQDALVAGIGGEAEGAGVVVDLGDGGQGAVVDVAVRSLRRAMTRSPIRNSWSAIWTPGPASWPI